MTAFQLKKIVLALGLSAAISAHAAGLGTMISSSKLGEPLNAEIELLAVAPADLSTIQAALASEQIYLEQLLEKPASYPFIRVEVGKNGKGQPVLKLSSTQPITEAFLDMLIQVDWPTGRLVKEYTLLLDPPGYQTNSVAEPPLLPKTEETPPQSATVTAAPAKPASSSSPTKVAEPASKPQVSQAVPSPQQPATNAVAETHATVKGDTLYAIARQMKPEGVSVEQMLAGLYQANQDAFDAQNMHRLKTGKILRAPDQALLEKISQQQARALLVTHTAAWHAYKNTLASAAKSAPSVAENASNRPQSGKISAPVQPAPSSASKDVLKLSAGESKAAAAADKSAKAAQDKQNALQEELTAKDNALKEQKSRAADLEKQVADMKKLLALKQDAMAKAEAEAAAHKSTANPPATEKPVTEKQNAPAAEAPQPAATPAVPATPPAEPATVAAVEPPPAAAVPDEAPKASFISALMQQLKSSNPALPAALVGLPLLLGVWLWLRTRRKKQIDSFEQAIVTSPATQMESNTVFGNSQTATSSDTSFLTDFSQSPTGGVIDAHEVDPIAEAEVYMAYGRDAQAEEILKDAIVKDPKRQELKVKLLEIYHNNENMTAFETLASDLYAKAGPTDPLWAKVVQMGQKLDPNNPLYRATAETSDVEFTETAATAKEDGYQLNFEAPPIEFEMSQPASAAVTEKDTALSLEASSPAQAELDADNAVAETIDANDTAEPVPVSEAFGTVSLDESGTSIDPVMATTDVPLADVDALDIEPKDTQATDTGATDAEAAVIEAPDVPPVTSMAAGGSLVFNAEQSQPAAPAPVEETPAEVGLALEALQAEVEAATPADALTPKALDLPTLDFDKAEAPALGAVTPGTAALAAEDAVFEKLPDLNFDMGGATAKTEPESSLTMGEITLEVSPEEASSFATMAAEDVLPEISLELGGEPAPVADTAESEEVDTKLDLIKAYIDMEDMIGAKELIEEVLQEGGENQRKRAEALLAQIS